MKKPKLFFVFSIVALFVVLSIWGIGTSSDGVKQHYQADRQLATCQQMVVVSYGDGNGISILGAVDTSKDGYLGFEIDFSPNLFEGPGDHYPISEVFDTPFHFLPGASGQLTIIDGETYLEIRCDGYYVAIPLENFTAVLLKYYYGPAKFNILPLYAGE